MEQGRHLPSKLLKLNHSDISLANCQVKEGRTATLEELGPLPSQAAWEEEGVKPTWCWIKGWKLPCLPKTQELIFLLRHRRAAVGRWLHKMGIASGDCPHCGKLETEVHLLEECLFTQKVKKRLSSWQKQVQPGSPAQWSASSLLHVKGQGIAGKAVQASLVGVLWAARWAVAAGESQQVMEVTERCKERTKEAILAWWWSKMTLCTSQDSQEKTLAKRSGLSQGSFKTDWHL